MARSSSKSSAKNNASLEGDVEELFQNLQFIQKQMDNLKKQLGNEKASEFDSIATPVKAFLAKNECQTLLNKMCLVQAFYNNININNLALSKD